MNENRLLHRLGLVEREIARRPTLSRRKSDDAIESTVTKREDGLFDWHTGCGLIVLAFDPDGAPDLRLAVR